MAVNRFNRQQPDYVLTLVRRPAGWLPSRIDDVPPNAQVVSRTLVASYEEAHDDLVRSNEIAIKNRLAYWAVVECPSASL